MTESNATSRRRRLIVLLAALVAVAALALFYHRLGVVATPTASSHPDGSPRKPDTPTAAQFRERAEVAAADRANADTLTRAWLGPQRWVVTPGTDSTIEMIEAELVDTTAADMMSAFVTIAALRDSAGSIELIGPLPHGRATLTGNVDSLVREGVRERMQGCTTHLRLPVRQSASAPGWRYGFVPGTVGFIAPNDTSAKRLREEGARLLGALPDTSLHPTILDSLRGATWSKPGISLWRDADVDVLVAHRRRASPTGDYEHYVQEQLVIAERPAGTERAFTTVVPWHTAYDTDETRSRWVEPAARVGPSRRFALLLGDRGKEGGGGSFLIRSRGKWRDAVSWSSGC